MQVVFEYEVSVEYCMVHLGNLVNLGASIRLDVFKSAIHLPLSYTENKISTMQASRSCPPENRMFNGVSAVVKERGSELS